MAASCTIYGVQKIMTLFKIHMCKNNNRVKIPGLEIETKDFFLCLKILEKPRKRY